MSEVNAKEMTKTPSLWQRMKPGNLIYFLSNPIFIIYI